MLFGLSYLRVGIYAGALVLIGYLAWREHTLVRKLAEVRVENRSLTDTLTAEREARAKERVNADEKSNAYQGDLRGIDAADDLGPVRLCYQPRPLSAAAPTSAARRSDAAGERRVEVESEGDPEPASRDVGPALNAYVEDCEANAAQLQRLQEWVRDR